MDNTAEQPKAELVVAAENPLRIWAAHCPFRRDGTPVLGQFGATMDSVLIITVDTWRQLCARVPELNHVVFEVGTFD